MNAALGRLTLILALVNGRKGDVKQGIGVYVALARASNPAAPI